MGMVGGGLGLRMRRTLMTEGTALDRRVRHVHARRASTVQDPQSGLRRSSWIGGGLHRNSTSHWRSAASVTALTKAECVNVSAAKNVFKALQWHDGRPRAIDLAKVEFADNSLAFSGKQPPPLLVRQFDIDESREISSATQYLSGMMHPTVNGEEITDEVLAPGYSNYQLSNEYRTYDVSQYLRNGANAIGVSLGNGVAYNRRDNLNPAVGRNAPYAWWQSTLQADGNLAANAEAGSTSVRVNNVTLYHLGGTINIDTAGGGERLESRVITAINNQTNAVQFTPGLELDHANGANVTGSGDNIAATDPTAGAAVLHRLIGRLEISYADGSSDVIVTDRSWLTALGPLVTDLWYSGADYDACREHAGWNQPGTELPSETWVSAGFVPPPNIATQIVARAAEPVKIQERFTPVSITNPFPGTWEWILGRTSWAGRS